MRVVFTSVSMCFVCRARVSCVRTFVPPYHLHLQFGYACRRFVSSCHLLVVHFRNSISWYLFNIMWRCFCPSTMSFILLRSLHGELDFYLTVALIGSDSRRYASFRKHGIRFYVLLFGEPSLCWLPLFIGLCVERSTLETLRDADFRFILWTFDTYHHCVFFHMFMGFLSNRNEERGLSSTFVVVAICHRCPLLYFGVVIMTALHDCGCRLVCSL